MKIYLVGGSVRDQLLKREHDERDWVVVGSTVEEMIALGYKPVGKDFPVFLHPKTHEEYALARTERKSGRGYTGFTFYADPSVSLEEDLIRRDLTINAMAQDETGHIIDPYNGQEDLQNKYLRHVSDAFVEDPVRLLRIARFAARFPTFTVHPDTLTMLQTMVSNNEVNALVAERVWKELERALTEVAPIRFFAVLDDSHALDVLFPNFKNTPSTLEKLKRVTDQSDMIEVRLAALLQDLDESTIKTICNKYRVPSNLKQFALLASKFKKHYEYSLTADANELLTLVERLDLFRRPERLTIFTASCRINVTDEIADKIYAHLNNALQAAKKIDIRDVVDVDVPGTEIANIIRQRRLSAIESVI